jgi:hypothetical protein
MPSSSSETGLEKKPLMSVEPKKALAFFGIFLVVIGILSGIGYGIFMGVKAAEGGAGGGQLEVQEEQQEQQEQVLIAIQPA